MTIIAGMEQDTLSPVDVAGIKNKWCFCKYSAISTEAIWCHFYALNVPKNGEQFD